MKYTVSLLLAAGAVAIAEHVILEPYAQCGGLSYRGAWECPTGYVCRASGADTAFPNYLCDLPGGSVVRAFPYNQCGGQGFIGPSLCTAGWECTVLNTFFSTCNIKANTTTPANPDPNLLTPGDKCGDARVDDPLQACVPGFTCAGPLTFGFYLCLPNPSTTTTAAASTTAVHTTTLVTTVKTTTTAKTTAKTTKTTTKTTTTKKTTTKKTATSTYKPYAA